MILVTEAVVAVVILVAGDGSYMISDQAGVDAGLTAAIFNEVI